MKTYILGINCVYHESSAALLKNGDIIGAVEEERFNRIKHGKKSDIETPGVCPLQSIDYLLKKEQITMKDIDKIGISFEPYSRLRNIEIDDHYERDNWGSEKGEKLFHSRCKRITPLLGNYYETKLENKIMFIPHHLCHSASAFYPSGFKNSAILSIDGIGENYTTSLSLGHETIIDEVKNMEYPHSVGFLWEKMSQFLGFTEYDASKVMGLGYLKHTKDFKIQYEMFKNIVYVSKGNFTINNNIIRFRTNDFSELEKVFNISQRQPGGEITTEHIKIASELQKITNDIILSLTNYLYDYVVQYKNEKKNLCLAGGVALNCVSNYEILKQNKWNNIFVQPAAHDAGTALGAALWLWHVHFLNKRKYTMNHPYLGPYYTDKEILNELKKHDDLEFTSYADIEQVAANLIEHGCVVGWFQGSMEFGPRALGNRSMLADPRYKNTKDLINFSVKNREMFRPLAPSVLAEHVDKWFDRSKTKTISDEWMLFAYPVKEDKKQYIPAVVHEDGTARIQVVHKNKNPKYHKLISEFYLKTEIPMVLNTSLNVQEPIVCSPQDAIDTFKKSNLDYLVMSNYLIEK